MDTLYLSGVLQVIKGYVSEVVKNTGHLPSDTDVAIQIRKYAVGVKFTLADFQYLAEGIHGQLPYYSYQYAYDMLSIQLSDMIQSGPTYTDTDVAGRGTALVVLGLVIAFLLLRKG